MCMLVILFIFSCSLVAHISVFIHTYISQHPHFAHFNTYGALFILLRDVFEISHGYLFDHLIFVGGSLSSYIKS